MAQVHAPGGTVISNTARYTYADPAGNVHNNSSNTVTVTVAVVSGIVITPDNGVAPSLVPSEITTLAYTVTNTGNTSDALYLPSQWRW